MATLSRRRRRLSALPIVVAIALLLVGTIATTFAIPAAAPPPTPAPALGSPFPDLTAPPTETPLGRYPATAETGVVASCVAGIDPATVPGPIAQAFCVCTLNRYEQLFPSYDEFQRAQTSGAITKQITTDVSNRCAQQIVGG